METYQTELARKYYLSDGVHYFYSRLEKESSEVRVILARPTKSLFHKERIIFNQKLDNRTCHRLMDYFEEKVLNLEKAGKLEKTGWYESNTVKID